MSTVLISLSIEQWREVYRILENDRGWQSHLNAIEEACKARELTIGFPVAMTWPMSAEIRKTNQELADEISRQMPAHPASWDCVDPTEESFPMDIEPIESVLAKLNDSPSPSHRDRQHSQSALWSV